MRSRLVLAGYVNNSATGADRCTVSRPIMQGQAVWDREPTMTRAFHCASPVTTTGTQRQGRSKRMKKAERRAWAEEAIATYRALWDLECGL